MTEDELVAAVQSAIDKGAGSLKAVQAHLKDELGWNDLNFSKVKRAYTAARAKQPQLSSEEKVERRKQQEREREQHRVRVRSGRADKTRLAIVFHAS